jgi:hypothetical protein
VCSRLHAAFWIKESIRWEQPDVKYKNSLLVTVQGLKGVENPVPFTLRWTTSPPANEMLPASVLRAPLVKSSALDRNFDGKADELHIKVRMPLESDEVVLSASVAAWVDVKLHSATRAAFDGMLLATAAGAGLQGSAARLDAQVAVRQREAIPFPASGVYAPYMQRPLVAPETAVSARDLALASLVEAYEGRNSKSTLICE